MSGARSHSRDPRPVWIYALRVIDDGGETVTKVGSTCNLAARLRQHQSWTRWHVADDAYARVWLLGTLTKREAFSIEREIHIALGRSFSHLHGRGEWYCAQAGDVIAAVEAVLLRPKFICSTKRLFFTARESDLAHVSSVS